MVVEMTREEFNEKLPKFVYEFKKHLGNEILKDADLTLKTVRSIEGKSRMTSSSGNLANSLELIPEGKDFVVSASAPYAAAVEYGSSPHWVPIAPLKEWARKKIGKEEVAYAIQKKIAKKGTPAQPFLEPAARNINVYLRAFEKAKKVFA